MTGRSQKSERAVLAGDFEKPVGIESPVDRKVGELDSSEKMGTGTQQINPRKEGWC
jgi:hypothetical protein